MAKTYEPHAIERARYAAWEQAGHFKPSAGDARYCIMLPPPNVTGSLHMGHAFQDTLMDALIRYHRMQGHSTLWQCGTDHAGIATQMVVERQLGLKGQSRHDLGREKFIEAVWEWKSESGGTISQQLRRMGASMDWSRERFTMDPALSKAVTEVFVRLHEEGLIYRGKRLVNWDPVLNTAISDLEVVSQEEQGQIWHIRYPLENGTGHLVVATTRPETLLGDVAVAVHPEDERYRRIIGKYLKLPLCDRSIPVIADSYVDPAFGSGCLKITPAHDFNDYIVGERHSLPKINIFTDNAAINDNAPAAYRGLDRYAARKKIVADLEAQGLLARVDPHKLMVPRGDRSQAVIEPYLTDQWFVSIAPLAEPAIKCVEDGRIRFVPENWSKTYFEWMRNIDDWCISRQLWWGHRIPAWYDRSGNIYVGRTESEARAKAGLSLDVALTQDPDVLDTWFSSALWPFSTLGWPDKTPELATFYPTSVLVTGFDIIFFWVARMIMLGLKFMGEVPFREVYIHGLVRDAEGNKMSKSKGNILDPIDLIDGITLEPLVVKRTTGLMRPEDAAKIEVATRRQFPNGIPSYGTDALRFTFASMATQGRDVRFDLGRIDGYRNFCNKIWNATRFVLMMVGDNPLKGTPSVASYGLPERWIRHRLRSALGEVRDSFESYRFDLSAQAIYEFVWDEYCDWYIELAKVTLNDEQAPDEVKHATRHTLVEVLEFSLRMMHPLVPFISDEIWCKVAPLMGKRGNTVMLEPFPNVAEVAPDDAAARTLDWMKTVILGVRRIRAESNLEPSKRIPLKVHGGSTAERQALQALEGYIKQLARVEKIERIDEVDDPDATTALAGETTLLVPLLDLIDINVERERIGKELARMTQDLQRVQGKLATESFVAKAPPEIVDKERKRATDLGDQITRLTDQLARLQR
ncbi:MAG: valine--tRNA ligase [Gammaproteobacteria bacterium]|nr:valine--tRNA ligase [Gammaproteobacteria bacterium]